MPAMRQSEMLVIAIPLHARILSVVSKVLVIDLIRAILNIDNFSKKVCKDSKMVVASFGSLLFLL